MLEERDRSYTFDDDHMDIEVGARGLIRAVRPAGDIAGLESIEPKEL